LYYWKENLLNSDLIGSEFYMGQGLFTIMLSLCYTPYMYVFSLGYVGYVG